MFEKLSALFLHPDFCFGVHLGTLSGFGWVLFMRFISRRVLKRETAMEQLSDIDTMLAWGCAIILAFLLVTWLDLR